MFIKTIEIKQYAVDDVIDTKIVVDGDRSGIKTTRKLGDSVIEDTIFLYDNSRRIDFEDKVDWKENILRSSANSLLKS